MKPMSNVVLAVLVTAAVAAPAFAQNLAQERGMELDLLPDRITAAEAEIAALDGRLADPALYTGPKEEIQRVSARRAELQADVERIYARWEELEAL